MKISYKTVLWGEEATEGEEKPDDVYQRRIINSEACCDQMGKLIEALHFPHLDGDPPDRLPLRLSDPFNFYVKYCPFCGEQIIFEEKERVKRVKSNTAPRVFYNFVEVPVESK